MPPSELPPYRLVVDDEIWRAIERLPHESQREDVLNFLMTYVIHSPNRPRPPHLKELANEQKGYWQYDIDRRYRLIYEVMESQREVRVIYVGFHPDWGRG